MSEADAMRLKTNIRPAGPARDDREAMRHGT